MNCGAYPDEPPFEVPLDRPLVDLDTIDAATSAARDGFARGGVVGQYVPNDGRFFARVAQPAEVPLWRTAATVFLIAYAVVATILLAVTG